MRPATRTTCHLIAGLAAALVLGSFTAAATVPDPFLNHAGKTEQSSAAASEDY